MYPNFLPPSFVFFFVIIIISSLDHLPTSFCIDDAQYVACAGQFQCANIPNLDYPFWGNDRPEHCGHPGFQLNCQGDFPLITIQSTQYRVLGIDIGTLIITVGRQDLLNDTCPTYLYQTSLDYTLFKLPPNDQNLTLYYGCPRVPLQVLRPYEFDCTANGTDSFSYFVTTQVNNLVPNLNGVTCSNNIKVPVNETAAQTLSVPTASRKDLQAVLAGGFGLEWEANDTNCNSCARSGGRCGYNSTYSSFTCLCIDRPYALRCNETGDGNSASSPKTLGIGDGENGGMPNRHQLMPCPSGRQGNPAAITLKHL